MSNEIGLLADEQIVLSADNDVLILTSKRVRYRSTLWGRSDLVSITLDSVASCGLTTRSYPIALIIAAALLVIAFIERNDAATYLVLLSVILVVAYFLTRRAVLSISSNGGQAILVPTKGMSPDSITKFIDALEKQKLG